VSSTIAPPFERELSERAPGSLAHAEPGLVQLLTDAVGAGYPPGATLLIVDAEGPVLRLFGGWSSIVGERIGTTRETIYDLASLTKVVVTVTLSVLQQQLGAWTLDDPVARWLDEFPRDDLTLRQLLTHTSGLVPHREFYRRARGPSEFTPAVFDEAVEAEPGPVAYSDLNYMLLGWALERCSGTALDVLFAEAVAAPLGMGTASYRPAREIRRRIAATELDGDQRLEPGLVWGEVHDGNAWALGGVAGHAGLFATADDLGRFVSALLAPDRHPILTAASIEELNRRQAGEPPDVRGLGWRLDASDWGPWPDSTYWHTGFTGTSLLVAPEVGMGVVLLTGGVHPVRRLDEQAELRTQVHRVVANAML
jgi:CubicO group peptidase (beta-lactamase class C family)